MRNPNQFIQPDVDADGARDLDPIGKLGLKNTCLLEMTKLELSERTCSKTKAVDAPQYERRGTPWTALDQENDILDYTRLCI